MDVTKQNFETALEEFEALLPTASFLAFDEEMSGINFPPSDPRHASTKENIADCPSVRYKKMLTVASHYNIIQFGLAMFHVKSNSSSEVGDESSDKSPEYTCRVYNFYLFPKEGVINLEAKAVEFNTKHDMDWNRWIRDGVTYVNRQKAGELRLKLEEELKSLGGNNASNGNPEEKKEKDRMILKKQQDIDTTTDAINKLKSWLTDESKKNETTYELITTNGYLRRFMHETLNYDFPHLVSEKSLTVDKTTGKSLKSGQATMVVRRFLNEEQKQQWLTQQTKEKLEKTNTQLGFYRIYEMIVAAKKPLVGHAVMYDLLFLMSHCEGNLPENYEKFKDLVKQRFPYIFDTQFLAKSTALAFLKQQDSNENAVKEQHDVKQNGSSNISKPVHRFGSMALGNLHKSLLEDALLQNSVKISFPKDTLHESKGYGGPDCSAFHEAGFDAYITGCCFAMLNQIAILEGKKELVFLTGVPSGGAPSGENFNKNHIGLNRISCFRTLFNGFDLGKEEVFLNDEWGVFIHVSGLKGWKQDKLTELLVKAMKEWDGDEENGNGKQELKLDDIKYIWLDDNATFVVLPERYRSFALSLIHETNFGIVSASFYTSFQGLNFQNRKDWLLGILDNKGHGVEQKGGVNGEPPAKRQRTGEGV